jgi:hypothetical protein
MYVHGNLWCLVRAQWTIEREKRCNLVTTFYFQPGHQAATISVLTPASSSLFSYEYWRPLRPRALPLSPSRRATQLVVIAAALLSKLAPTDF